MKKRKTVVSSQAKTRIFVFPILGISIENFRYRCTSILLQYIDAYTYNIDKPRQFTITRSPTTFQVLHSLTVIVNSKQITLVKVGTLVKVSCCMAF